MNANKIFYIGSNYWTNIVFVKHILLYISGSWPIRVRFLHSWAGCSKLDSWQRTQPSTRWLWKPAARTESEEWLSMYRDGGPRKDLNETLSFVSESCLWALLTWRAVDFVHGRWIAPYTSTQNTRQNTETTLCCEHSSVVVWGSMRVAFQLFEIHLCT